MSSASTSTTTATYGQSYNPASYGSNNNYYSGNSNGSVPTATTSAATAVNMNDSSRYTNSSYDARTPPRPPATIAHLQSQTRIPDSDARLPLKSLLRSADSYRMQGQQREREGDIEAAFVAFGVAAQYALELVPAHAEYGERLTREQRAALEKVRRSLYAGLTFI
ncbi:hypothetical protein BDZ89DRAFT_95960 [Hymenopellis radicata]|nr:hypothetical protein BDZ89DRAFT_95960 [Hymenopellis radicata]